jgi:hypothetical protein
MSQLQMMEDGLVKPPVKSKWLSRYDTFRHKWLLERDGQVVASFPEAEEQLCNKLANAGNDRSWDVC